jgi:uncharacterized membrane protein
MKNSKYAVMTAGAAIGVVSAAVQTIERIEQLKNIGKALPCDLNAVFSCSTVLASPQASVFGFSNSILCTILFTIFLAIGIAGWAGSAMPRKLRLAVQSLSLFTLAFALWFLWQSTYVIGALCIFCIFCFAGLLAVNAMWLRINVLDLPIGERARAIVAQSIKTNIDIFAWLLLGVLVALAMVLQFA